MPALRLGDIASQFQLELTGDPEQLIVGLCALSPGEPGKLAFAAHARYAEQVTASLAAAVIVPAALREQAGNTLVAPHSQLAFAQVAALFAHDERPDLGVHPSASIHASAQIGEHVRIGAHCTVGADTVLGDGCAVGDGSSIGRQVQIGPDGDIGARVVVADRVQIGARVLILPGAVIGSRGYGNVHDGKRWHAMPQLGTVRIGDDVEIGANTTIDRGALGDTVIEDNVRIDNLCQIAHNVHIGARTALASGVGIAGSAIIGRDCMLGGQVGVNGHIRIADGAIINGGAKVLQSVEQGGQYGSGTPLMPVMAWRRFMALAGQLEQRLKKLERERRT